MLVNKLNCRSGSIFRNRIIVLTNTTKRCINNKAEKVIGNIEIENLSQTRIGLCVSLSLKTAVPCSMASSWS